MAGLAVWVACTGTALRCGAEETKAVTDASAVAAALAAGRPGPIARSVDGAVDEVIRKHFSCGHGEDEKVPCFPVSVERQWQYSVADSLQHLEFDSSPAPGRPPTVDEMGSARPGPLSASGGVGVDVDALACKAKALFKKMSGRGLTYYLYRVWDKDGERVALRDRAFEAENYSATPSFHYVSLGTFGDECAAVAAWRKALRETRARAAAGEAEGPATGYAGAEPSPGASDPAASPPPD